MQCFSWRLEQPAQPKCLPLWEGVGHSKPDFLASLIFMDTVNEQGCKDAMKIKLLNFFQLIFRSYYKKDNKIILFIQYVNGK